MNQCGDVLFYAYDIDGISLNSPSNRLADFISWDPSNGMTLYTEDMSLHGTFVEMTFELKACPVTRVDVPDIGVFEITPNG